MSRRKRIYTYGAFDVVHRGHISLLRSAKCLGCHLTVGILSDEAIRERKGKDRPVNKQVDRAEIIKALDCVDRVVFQQTYDPSFRLIESGADVLTKGDDWDWCREVAKKAGKTFIPLKYSQGYSTSELIRKIRS